MSSDFIRSIPKELRINSEEVIQYLTTRLGAYVRENAGKGAGVVGISGGVDSSVAAYLTVKALGSRNTHLFFLPSESTPKKDEEDTLTLVKMLEANLQTVSIDPCVSALCDALGKIKTNRIVVGNIKARARMILLHAFANVRQGLVIGTGDKSELTIGYFTKFGDGGVDVLPIGDLYKSQVRQLAAHIGLPERIYRKAPSPALWEGQSAESELGIDYLALDRILFYRFDLTWGEELIARKLGIPVQQIMRVVDLVKRTQHKRLPPEIFKLSLRSQSSD